MKRICFLLKSMPDKYLCAGFFVRMKLHGVDVEYSSLKEVPAIKPDTLYVTDSKEQFDILRGLSIEALVYAHCNDDLDMFPDSSYFVMDAEHTEFLYFKRVYERINNIPWEMVNTKRLLLRETTEEDVDEFVKLYSNPKMTEFIEKLYPDVEEEKKYAAEYREKVYAVQGFGIWTVVRKSDGKIIGRAGLTAREGFDELEIGFAIGVDYWNKGYGTEAVRGILDFAKKNNMGRINALVMQGNDTSKRLLAREGFSKISETNMNNVLYEVWQR